MKKVLIIIILLFLTACTKFPEGTKLMETTYKNIREPAVAGQFYPGDASRLSIEIEKYLKAAREKKFTGQAKAIIVPHAGYDFSAPVAAHSYKQLQGKTINTAVIICNSHTTYFNGVAVDNNDAWQTPLGLVGVDKVLAQKLVKADTAINYNNQAHAADHTLEVQLPFLQTVLTGEFRIVPILFGNTHDDSYKKLAQALAANLGDNDIVVISTDMSHYPSYKDANRIDKETLAAIKTLNVSKLEEHVINIEGQRVPGEDTVLCGIDGVKTVMALANLANWDLVEILHYANSGDVPIGDKDRVVGYGAMVFGQEQTTDDRQQTTEKGEIDLDNILNEQQQKELLNIARTTVETYVREGKKADFNITDERLQWKEGAFVTLHKNEQLRGCIGQIVPTDKPIWQVVRDIAISSCSEDHRFNPVSEKELDKLDYEVSVLSVPKKIDNWKNIELGKHGVIVRKGLFHSGVFLPQVATETGWSREEFLSQLCAQKAGLPGDCYKDEDVELQTFTAQVFSEK